MVDNGFVQFRFDITQKEDGGDAADGPERWVVDTSGDVGERGNIVSTAGGEIHTVSRSEICFHQTMILGGHF